MLIGDWPIPDHAVYRAESYGQRGLDSISADPRPWMPYRLDATSPHLFQSFRGRRVFWNANTFTSSLVTRTSLHPLRSRGRLGFLYRLDTLRFLPRDGLSFGRSPTLRGRDGLCV